MTKKVVKTRTSKLAYSIGVRRGKHIAHNKARWIGSKIRSGNAKDGARAVAKSIRRSLRKTGRKKTGRYSAARYA